MPPDPPRYSGRYAPTGAVISTPKLLKLSTALHGQRYQQLNFPLHIRY